MTTLEKPYFMQDKRWYKEDAFGDYGYVLTELGKSLPKVVKSYEEFYADLEPDFSEE